MGRMSFHRQTQWKRFRQIDRLIAQKQLKSVVENETNAVYLYLDF